MTDPAYTEHSPETVAVLAKLYDAHTAARNVTAKSLEAVPFCSLTQITEFEAELIKVFIGRYVEGVDGRYRLTIAGRYLYMGIKFRVGR